jgi:elongation factor Ts
MKVAPEKGTIAAYMHNDIALTEGIKSHFLPNTKVSVGRTGAILVLEHTKSKDQGINESLNTLAYKLAMHCVAAKPSYLSQTSVPAAVLEKEKDILKEQIAQSGKKETKFLDKIVAGKLGKFYQSFVLSDQQYMISDDPSNAPAVSKVLEAKKTEFGLSEIPVIAGFARFQVGENTGAAPAAETGASASA